MKRQFVLFFSLILIGFSFSAKGQASGCQPNMDFELGNTSVWTYYVGTCCPLIAGVNQINAVVPSPPLPGRHVLTTGAALDYYGSFPIVSPGGGAYSFKLGHDTVNYCAEKARYMIHIPSGSTNYSIIYRYAIVLQDGGTSHGPTNQPRFDINLFDSASAAPVSCAQYNFVASSSIPGFATSPHSGSAGGTTLDVHYKPWTTGSINLSGLAGHTIEADFAAGGCGLGGHWGYGYIDMSCGLFQIAAVGCDDTTATLTAPDGFSGYGWYDSATYTTLYGATQSVTVPMPAVPTTYAVILTPYTGFGCPDTLFTHIIPSHLRLHPTHDTGICFGGSLTLTSGATDISLPLTYAWAPDPSLSCTSCANPIANPTGPTAYVVTVTNAVGCTRTDTINITRGHVVADFTSINETCFGGNNGSATAFPTVGIAPYFYSWSNGATTATDNNLTAGVYSVTITDVTGCTGDTSVTITQPLENYFSVVSSTNPDSCFGSNGTITLGGSTPGTNGLIPGNTYAITYLFNGTPRSVNLVASAAGTVVISGLPQGVVTNIGVDITVTPYCPFNIIPGPVNITDPPNPAPPSVWSNSPICNMSALNLDVSDVTPAVGYSWSGPSGYTSNLSNPVIANAGMSTAAGVYNVTVTVIATNCKSTGNTNVVITAIPQPSINYSTHLCAGDSIVLTSSSANGANVFSWAGPLAFSSLEQNPVIHNATVASSGIYTVTMILNGCVNTITADVVVNPIPPAPTVTDTTYCQFVTPSALNVVGTNLLWYPSMAGGTGSAVVPTPSTIVPGYFTWYVNQTTDSGCAGPITPINVRVYAVAAPYITLSDTVICKGTKITFTALGTGDDFSGVTWNFGNGDSIVNVNPIEYSFDTTGTFAVTANAYYNICPDVSLVRNVTVIPYPILYVGSDTTICEGNTTLNLWDHYNSGNPNASWLWSTGETSSSIYVNTAGFYYVTVNIDGCAASDSVSILRDCYVAMPNVFTPNGDGVNDYFFPRQYLARGLTSFKMEIYNRWGEMIFSTTRTDGLGWDGRYNGTPQPEGIFIYNMDVTFKDGVSEHHQGNVTLIR